MIKGWTAEAMNTAPDSQNQIHGDDIARKYGFKGGLVPGVTISAYLIQPAVDSWGMDWLERGAAHVRVSSPLYDGEQFTVNITQEFKDHYKAELARPDGTVSATADISLTGPVETAGTPPVRRMDQIAEKDFIGPKASFETFKQLKQEGCLAFRYRWGSKHRMNAYIENQALMPELLRLDGGGYANMSFILGCSNWVLASNAQMNPWVHLETRSQNFRAVPADTRIIAEMDIDNFYEKKGHEFIDVNVNLFDEANDDCLAVIALRAIYKLRGM
ncbi:MAG: hypothetical protein WD002_03235 [Pseudomonadales bacterium]